MSKKRDNLFERYIDKAVLGVAMLLSLWLLWVFILGNPYAVEYGSVKLGPGEIDNHIKDQEVQQLLSKLGEAPKAKSYTKNRRAEFAKMVACSINNIADDVHFPIPGYGRKVSVDSRIYVLPDIDEVSDVSVERVRSVVYVPTEPVGANNPYGMALTDFGDIDLVTIEASFNVASLYKNFEQCFSGRQVRRDWQDKNLAKPVFAFVGLERQRKVDDGSFGEWQEVKRTKVDNLKVMLGNIPDKIDDKHTANLLMVKFDEFSVQQRILQPGAYDFAASNEDWLPPRFHKEYAKLMKAEAEKLRREQQQLERGGLDPGAMGRAGALGGREGRAGGGRAGAQGGRGGRAGGGRAGAQGGRGRANTGRQSTRGRQGTSQLAEERDKRKKKERTVKDVYDDFKKIMLTEKTNLAKMREPLLFWAHDDTVVPGESYRYRIRLGVFNPIAGRDWFREDQKDYKDKPILWSGYSKVTETVQVPLMMHFFPFEVAVKEEKGVKIKVAKFHNGKWRNEDFEVRPGEMIGKTIERKPKSGGPQTIGYGLGSDGFTSSSDTEMIDFSTGASLVDVVETSDWMGVNMLRQRDYADILYTTDDTSIAHLAVKMRNWPEELQQQFNVVKAAEKEVVQMKVRSSGAGQLQQSGQPGSMPTGRPGGGRMRGRMGGRMRGRVPPGGR